MKWLYFLQGLAYEWTGIHWCEIQSHKELWAGCGTWDEAPVKVPCIPPGRGCGRFRAGLASLDAMDALDASRIKHPMGPIKHSMDTLEHPSHLMMDAMDGISGSYGSWGKRGFCSFVFALPCLLEKMRCNSKRTPLLPAGEFLGRKNRDKPELPISS